MSDPRRLEGARVFCHQCSNEWDRANGGLTCPRCEGEFTEILPAGGLLPANDGEPVADPPPSLPRHPFADRPNFTERQSFADRPSLADPLADRQPFADPLADRQPFAGRHPFADHNPWAHEPDSGDGDFTTIQFNTPHGGRGTFSYTSRTFTTRGPPPPMFPFAPFGTGQRLGGGLETRGGIFPRDPRTQQGPQPGDLQDILSMIFQTMNNGAFAQPRRPGERPDGPPNPFELLTAILNPGNGRHGDAVWSQEAFDRIVEQLAEQNQMSTAPGPASESAIKSLPTKKVEKDMLGSDGTAECSICMDNVEIGTDVTVLPCKHWFHGECVVAWLKEHDTCPHCRKPITNPEEQPQSSRRRSSRRSSSIGSLFVADASRENPLRTPDSPSALREQRQPFYGSRRDHEERPDRPRRHSSSNNGRGGRSDNSGNGGGGVTGWIRNHMGLGG